MKFAETRSVVIILVLLGRCFFTHGDVSAQEPPTQIWNGPNTTFYKAAYADWTQPENQDRISDTVWFTRQNVSSLYNYKWWQDNVGRDAFPGGWPDGELFLDFWGGDPENMTFGPGSTRGVRWGILSDAGALIPWPEFPHYAVLGDPTNFTTFHRLASMIDDLDRGTYNGYSYESLPDPWTSMDQLVGKELAVWIPEENIYFTLTFTEWGTRNTGGSVGYTRSTRPPFTISDFARPMGKKKKLGSTLPVKFQLFFDGVEIQSQDELDSVLTENGCGAACPEIFITDVTDPANEIGLDLPEELDNVGEGGEVGFCFRFSDGNWIYNLKLPPSTLECQRFYSGNTYMVDVLIGDCVLSPGNELFQIK